MTDLAKMERLLPLATKAPWREDGYRAYAQKDGEEVVLFEIKYTPAEYEDLELLVALRNGAADLIRDARELAIARAEIERLRANIDTAERRLSEATIEAIRQGSKMRDEIARLTSAGRRAVVALAHASEAMPQYTADYQALSDALAQETTT